MIDFFITIFYTYNGDEMENYLKGKIENKKSMIFLILFRSISVIIILISLYLIFNWYSENQASKKLLEKAVSNIKIEKVLVKTKEYTVLDVNFEELIKINNDTTGWINLENSSINYPVVKTKDNYFYLNHTFDKSYNSSGWIFEDYRCKPNFTSKNTTIYGHNRKDTSMFATLKNVIEEDWYKKSKYLTITTPEGNRIYEVFSTYKIKAETYYSTPDFISDSEYFEFLKNIKNRSVYDFGAAPSISDSIVTLSTCANNNSYRVVLHAKLVSIIPNNKQ